MNSMAEDVTMFTDDTVVCDGPITPGPTLQAWAAGSDQLEQQTLAGQRAAVDGFTFPTRQLQSEYLSWVFRRISAALTDEVGLTVHRAAATDITDGFDGRQHVWLEGRDRPLVVDTVILAMGHLDSRPGGEYAQLREFALYHGLYHQPPAFFEETDTAAIAPGDNVVLRGFGLAFIDLMAMLTEGRGGRFRTAADGRLEYVASGAEPVLYVGSRRGVPYQAKLEYHLPSPLATLPRFLTPTALRALGDRVEFDRDVLPLIRKELGWAYYHQLFTAHSGRIRTDWATFAAAYESLDWDSDRRVDLVARAVPDPADRLDLDRLDRPLDNLRFASFEELQDHLRTYLSANRQRHTDPAFSADLALFEAFLAAVGLVAPILPALTARSRAVEFPAWFDLFNYVDSGPPGHRLDQLVALSEAGVVHFLGADMWVDTDCQRGVYRAGSASWSGSIEATALIEARLPKPNVNDSRDQLVRNLHQRGECAEETLVEESTGITYSTGLIRVDRDTAQLLGRSGSPHPRRLAFGIFTNGGSSSGFTRPRRNGLFFRQNDAAARQLLADVASVSVLSGPWQITTSSNDRRALPRRDVAARIGYRPRSAAGVAGPQSSRQPPP
jgi:uncharacterized NAD(P)/FAD-binding protein YdhS